MCDVLDIPSCLVTVDIEKAFHSLDHNFLLSVLKIFAFGKNFIYWIKILNGQQSFVTIGGLQLHILIERKMHARVIPYRHTCLYLL